MLASNGKVVDMIERHAEWRWVQYGRISGNVENKGYDLLDKV